MKYYINNYEVFFNKDTNNIDFVLKSQDNDFVITDIEGNNSLPPVNVIQHLLEIMLDDNIKYISGLEDLKNIENLCVGDYFIYFTMGKDLTEIYHLVEIGNVVENNKRLLTEIVMEI